MNDIMQTIAVYALPVLFAITLHEAAHAYAAKYFGDSTAFLAGRMSMNPLKHIDLLGTIVIPIALYIATEGKFVFGYAKPVPVDFGNLRNPKKQMAWVALAGPASNFVMAFGWMVASLLLGAGGVQEPFLWEMAKAGVLVNILMFSFNLVPIPPLDGGRIVTSLLPHKLAYQFARIEPYGFFIVLALIYFKILNFWVVPVAVLTETLLHLILSPLSFLLN
ncbi:site-2 protease family protein [Rugamonas rubra]|jgi:Zn-dependent protease|uniref:Zn-dependent protease (Includes SpoIVFB) n=1 Tax=Rugamonas rubra TaxID=758825 RepID=A0A1I4MIG9_9BURK|nr:site-2 protease family protein [Rugamonas rubra]SFM02885.1 Zn-dependent protease (includes SpoIVFB) [Rugamonas rubra]